MISVSSLLGGCLPIIISHELAARGDAKIIETFRRAYIVQRQADGKTEDQIASEIAKIDRTWQIDLAVSGGDLMASTVPNQLNISGCSEEFDETRPAPNHKECKAKADEQKRLLQEAEITLTPEEVR